MERTHTLNRIYRATAAVAKFNLNLVPLKQKFLVTIIAEHEIAAISILRVVVAVVVVVKRIGEKDQSAAAVEAAVRSK